MQHFLGSTRTVQRHQGLVSTVFKEYRNNFGLFWQVMFPVILVSIVGYLFFNFVVPESQWTFSTSGVKAYSLYAFNHESRTIEPAPVRTGVTAGVGFDLSSFSIGLLWLTMCPLALVIVSQHKGINVTSGEVWHRTYRKLFSILGACILMMLASGGPFIILASIMAGFTEYFIQDPLTGSSTLLRFLTLIFGVVAVYFLMRWSLCNQCIIIENLSAIPSLRRSGELVRGAWGQFFGTYLLLVLGTAILTNAVTILTLFLLLMTAPEFAKLAEVLQSGKLFGLFFGGYAAINLSSPPIWAITVMVTVNTLIHAILAPIWAIVTTQLYIERAGIPEKV